MANNILITGATSGIGEALALYYADHGVQNLVLHKEDHGFHDKLGETTTVWVVGTLVVVVG